MKGESYDIKILSDPEFIKFNRKDVIDYNNAKTIELLNQ